MLNHLLHLFIPRRSNNHRSQLLHPAGLALLMAIFLFSNASIRLLAAFDQDLVRGNVLGYASNISADEVISLTNQERLKVGQKPLIHNLILSQAAQAKAADVFTFNYWAHNNPETGKRPWDFIREAGYSYRYAGENLARDFGDTASLVAAWMASPTHRDNIVSDRYTEIGVAVVNGSLQGIETTLVVQMFGQPSTAQAISSASTLGDQKTQIQTVPEAFQPQEEKSEPVAAVPVGFVAASEPPASPSLFPPLAISKAVSISVLLVLSLTLIVDYLLIKRRRTIRVAGKNLAHLGFIGVIIIIVLLSGPGGIL